MEEGHFLLFLLLAFSLGELSVSVLPLTSAHLAVVDLVGNCW